jgi:hypothetical protein
VEQIIFTIFFWPKILGRWSLDSRIKKNVPPRSPPMYIDCGPAVHSTVFDSPWRKEAATCQWFLCSPGWQALTYTHVIMYCLGLDMVRNWRHPKSEGLDWPHTDLTSDHGRYQSGYESIWLTFQILFIWFYRFYMSSDECQQLARFIIPTCRNHLAQPWGTLGTKG